MLSNHAQHMMVDAYQMVNDHNSSSKSLPQVSKKLWLEIVAIAKEWNYPGQYYKDDTSLMCYTVVIIIIYFYMTYQI